VTHLTLLATLSDVPIWRMQVIWGADSDLARDRLVITPHFNDTGLGDDPEGLATDLAAALETWGGWGTARRTQVKVYDAEGTPPVFPVADVIRNQSAFPASGSPREVALCLSYFAERNVARRRGRLYIPCPILTGGTPTGRPSAANRQKVADLVPIFAGLGGVDVDWVVWSRADGVARKVTDWWVDDEWDVVRSRGLTRTTRLAGTTGG